jgi:GNAT superfamily N-acetyltransferase
LSPELAGSQVSHILVIAIEAAGTNAWVAVHWSASRGTPMPEEGVHSFVRGWQAAAKAPFSGSARILSLYDDSDTDAVAIAAVWSAGVGRPGLIEPKGVHQDHRDHGYGTMITQAAAAALREMGSSSAAVCAESSNVGAVSTDLAAGFTAHAEVSDLRRGS